MSAARQQRGLLTIFNIVEACDEDSDYVIEEIQSIVDDPRFDIPDDGVSIENIEALMKRHAYYSNQYPYLTGLWGKMRVNSPRTDPRRIAVRDYLEKAASSCKMKYDGASRILTDIQTIREESKGQKIW